MSEKEMRAIIAANISNLLAEHKMTKKELAARIHVSDTSVSNWCTGQKVPRMDKIDAMAQVFGIHRNDFYVDKSNSHPPQHQPFTDADLKFALFGDATIDDELLEDVKQFAQFAKAQKERKKSNDQSD